MREQGEEQTAAWERALREVLRPAELPMGFADRVVAAAAKTERGGNASWWRGWLRQRGLGNGSRHGGASWHGRWGQLAAGGAVAASLLAGSLLAGSKAVEGVHQRRERAAARVAANRQFALATRITDEALERTRTQLRRAGVMAEE